MRHAKAITMCMAYQMYSECAKGGMDASWKRKYPMSTTAFRNQLLEQMYKYCSVDLEYSSDNKTRANTNTKEEEGHSEAATGEGFRQKVSSFVCIVFECKKSTG